jgi:hypothetical protein
MVEATTSELSQVSTQDGGNSSSTLEPAPVLSLTSEITTEYLILPHKIVKDNQSEYGKPMEELTRNGQFFTWIKLVS